MQIGKRIARLWPRAVVFFKRITSSQVECKEPDIIIDSCDVNRRSLHYVSQHPAFFQSILDPLLQRGIHLAQCKFGEPLLRHIADMDGQFAMLDRIKAGDRNFKTAAGSIEFLVVGLRLAGAKHLIAKGDLPFDLP